MSLSRRAHKARKRYARWQRRIDRGMIAIEVALVSLVILAGGRLLGAW